MVFYTFYPSPLGKLLLLSDGTALTKLQCSTGPAPGVFAPELPVFRQTAQWLDRYFAGGDPDTAGLPLAPEGTAFQRAVWEILLRIPRGRTRSYGDIAGELAAALGKENMSAQAVGQAVGRNPIWIIIPCHRVLGARGQLTGYAGGPEKKIWLLRHEGHND